MESWRKCKCRVEWEKIPGVKGSQVYRTLELRDCESGLNRVLIPRYSREMLPPPVSVPATENRPLPPLHQTESPVADPFVISLESNSCLVLDKIGVCVRQRIFKRTYPDCKIVAG